MLKYFATNKYSFTAGALKEKFGFSLFRVVILLYRCIVSIWLMMFFIPEKVFSSPPDWVPMSGLQYSMQVVALLELDEGLYSTDSDDIVGAFVGDECRGIASPLQDFNGLIFLSIASNLQQGELINFKAYIAQQDAVFEINETIFFENLGELGTFEEPFIFTLIDLPPPVYYIIQANSTVGGSIVPDGNVSVLSGYDQLFEMFPFEGYHIYSVLVDGVDQGGVLSYLFENVTSNHQITADFAINEYTLTYLNVENGNIEGELIQIVEYGQDGSPVLAVPDIGYYFDSWSDGETDNPRVELNVTSNLTVFPVYLPESFTISASSSAGGSIVPEGMITVNFGEDFTFELNQSTGYSYDYLLVDGVNIGNPLQFTFENITDNHTIYAHFTKLSYVIEASAGTFGAIYPSGQVNVEYGQNQLFEIRPEFGYQIEDVLVDNYSQGPIAFYLFENVTEGHDIFASFSIMTDLKPKKQATFQIYPNPATDHITISLSGYYCADIIDQVYSIHDAFGRVLLEGDITSDKIVIDISKLPQGNYFIDYNNNKLQILIKQ